jgi:alcohol dehydrogenase class IV
MTLRTTWTFHTAGKLLFGPGAIQQLGAIVRQLDCSRVLLITDPQLVRAGIAPQVETPLAAADLTFERFDGGQPEPSLQAAAAAIQAARRFQPDAIIGLGGGSNMDLAKIAAAAYTHGGTPQDYLGEDRIPGPILPLICIPTTSGTGSEVSAASVLTDTAQQLKIGALSNYLRPKVALVDPNLTLSCPAQVTADSGIDALTHAIEAYTAVDNETFPLPAGETSTYQGRHPLGDCLAEKAISLIGQHLVTAVQQPANPAAREGMALAATLAGMAFSNVGVAVVHALEYPVGGATHCSHGAGNGLLLPFVMRFNQSLRQREFARIAQLLGRDVAGCDETAAANQAIAAVEDLKQQIGIPGHLSDLGVTREQLPAFAEKAFQIKRILRVNPRPVTVADLEQILTWAL